ncbi:hypothetical protein LK07_19155 [Streptomyces pluripotens]|uniref:HTH-like domain-containing protein n=1 Tax=Streptomyces pluripotens TaxID=1355015 RepID=A0A221P0L1_9ACTN|nr:hypothetical protein LK06_017995 [Streptomyces pluripotens]ASN25777.1 hypothetical protein LK07_19155 [Streptomyces pluripotens]
MLHIASHHTYGVPRVHAELRHLGRQVNRKRVARVMRERDIRGINRRKRRSLPRSLENFAAANRRYHLRRGLVRVRRLVPRPHPHLTQRPLYGPCRPYRGRSLLFPGH